MLLLLLILDRLWKHVAVVYFFGRLYSPVLRRLRAQHPDITFRRRADAFTTLARAITGQQISVKAAQTIWNRVVAAAGGSTSRLAAPAILALDPAALSDLQLNSALRNDAGRVGQNIEAALAEGDPDLAASFAELARDRNLSLIHISEPTRPY